MDRSPPASPPAALAALLQMNPAQFSQVVHDFAIHWRHSTHSHIDVSSIGVSAQFQPNELLAEPTARGLAWGLGLDYGGMGAFSIALFEWMKQLDGYDVEDVSLESIGDVGE